MKTRPHIVTQTALYDTSGLRRNADLIAARMGTGARLANVLGYSQVIIRVMKIILDLTMHNDCFVRRRDVLASPPLRKLVMEQLGGAHALLRWRRQNTWNKARLASIASGEYRPVPEPHIPLTAECHKRRPQPTQSPAGHASAVLSVASKSGPAKFRLPVLQNLRYVHRPRPKLLRRAKPQRRYPSVVLWPHELDGQYVPDFTSRAARPAGCEYPPAAITAMTPAGLPNCSAGARDSPFS